MKLLDGQELAGFIKERQAKDVRRLKSAQINPKLAIIQAKNDPVINTYIRLKRSYAADIDVEVDLHKVTQAAIPELITQLNKDQTVSGIIVQLPLSDSAATDDIVNLVTASKDVDALARNTKFDPAAPLAILWLLNGYNIELKSKKILLVGRGKLVGAPLEKMLRNSGYNVAVVDRDVENLTAQTKDADIVITATGSPSIIKPEMIKQGAIVVDAGTSSEDGRTVGDLDPAIYERDDLTITPVKGGVGPLTVCALFDNVIRAAQDAG